jgi:hypothetical protein
VRRQLRRRRTLRCHDGAWALTLRARSFAALQDISFLTNRAAVLFEQAKYDECIKARAAAGCRRTARCLTDTRRRGAPYRTATTPWRRGRRCARISRRVQRCALAACRARLSLGAPVQMLARAMARKGNALFKKGDLEAAVAVYGKVRDGGGSGGCARACWAGADAACGARSR